MSFEILAAIDVADGRLVSTHSSGEPATVEAFGGSPISAARTFVEAGARWLHVVDVDRVRGRQPDLTLITSIAQAGAAVQASGGIESERAAREALDAGATRVVLGSMMLADVTTLVATVAALGERAVVGIDADGHVIRPRSAASLELPLAETLAGLRETGARRYLYTAVSRVARLSGPDLRGVEATSAALGGPVLAAGGIRGVRDVVALRELGPDMVEGVVVGRALYERVDLRDVVAAVG